MKQRILMAIASLCALCMLAGCTAAPGGAGSGLPETWDGETASPPLHDPPLSDSTLHTSPQPAASGTPAAGDALEMQLVFSGMGNFDSSLSGNEAGAYSLLSSPEDFSARLIYYDYATRQLIWLSDQMVVTNDEENPGWIEDTFGGAYPIAANGKLYVVKYGKSPVPAIGYGGSPSFLLQMEPNAANCKKLTVPQGSLLYHNTGIAADGDDLYLLLEDYDAAAMQITDISLCRADFAGNRFERLASFGAEKTTAIVGVYADGLVLQRSWLPAEAADSGRQEQLSYQQYTLELYSLSRNEVIGTGFSWRQGELAGAKPLVFGPGTVYYLKAGETRLYGRNLQTGEETVLAEDLLKDIPTHGDTGVGLTLKLFDDHLFFYVSDEDGARTYSYSLATREVLPCSLTYEQEGDEIPVLICAESEEYFMVDAGIVGLQLPAAGTDGTFYVLDSYIPRYALMKKEDYWNSVPDYIFFDDALLRAWDLSR